MSESSTLKIREVFSILTQGIEITEYEVNPENQNKSSVSHRICWLDSDIYRICIDSARPSIAERIKGKISPGIYLRDISEVREGAFCNNFIKNKTVPNDVDCCLSLIGSERSISLYYPSKFTRDWFYHRFALLIEDITADDERQQRRYKPYALDHRDITVAQREAANHVGTLLSRGIKTRYHERSGKILDVIMSYDKEQGRLVLTIPRDGIFGGANLEVKSIDINDVSELRPGCHSLGFVKTKSTNLHKVTMAIIASESVFEVEVVNEATRDTFIEKLFYFTASRRSVEASHPIHAHNTNNTGNGNGAAVHDIRTVSRTNQNNFHTI